MARPKKRPTWSDLPDMMTVEQAAAYLDISKPTAYAEIHAGNIPSLRFGMSGRVIRIPKAGLARMEGREPEAPRTLQVITGRLA